MVKPIKTYVFLDNYIALFNDPNSIRVVGNTLFYLLILLAINFVLPFILSFILSCIVKKGNGFYKTAFFLPSVISLVVGSMIYIWILNPITGPIAKAMHGLGLYVPIWSKTEGLVIVVISIITSWKVFGYNFIVLLGGVSGIPKEVLDAALLDNIPMRKVFKDIIIPMSSATAIYVFIMTIVQGLQYVFTPIKIITQGGPHYASSNLIYHAFHNAFVLYDTGIASALSILTMVVFTVLLWVEFHFVEKGAYYEN